MGLQPPKRGWSALPFLEQPPDLKKSAHKTPLRVNSPLTQSNLVPFAWFTRNAIEISSLRGKWASGRILSMYELPKK